MENNIEVSVNTGDTLRANFKSEQTSNGKVSATFHIDPDVREQLQLLAFLTNKSQASLVEKALTTLVQTSDVKMPKSCHIFFKSQLTK